MLNIVRSILISLILLVAGVAYPIERLIVQGSQITDPHGDPVELRGINWSEPEFCTQDDMRLMKRWGVNVIRVWCDEASIHETYGYGDRGKFDIAQVIDWATEEEIHLILVLGELDYSPTNNLKPWKDRQARFRMEQAVDLLAFNVATKDAVFAIEFQNEPPVGLEEIKEYTQFNKMMAWSIRAYAPLTSVIVHGPRRLDDLGPDVLTGISYVIYSVNFWEPWPFTHTNPAQPWPQGDQDDLWLDRRLSILSNFRTQYNVPVMVTEFGAMIHAPGDDEIEWVRAVTKSLDERNIPGLYWGFRSYRASSFHLFYNEVDKQKPPVFREWREMREELQGWWDGISFEEL